MKRAPALAALLLLALTACGGTDASDTGDGSESAVVAGGARYTVDFPHYTGGEPGYDVDHYGYEVRVAGRPADSCEAVLVQDLKGYATKAEAQAVFGKLLVNVAKLHAVVLDAGHPIDQPELTKYSVYVEPPDGDESLPESMVAAGGCALDSRAEGTKLGDEAMSALQALARARH